MHPASEPEQPVELTPVPTVCAFDPGGTTGWSVMSVHPDALIDPEVLVLDNMLNWQHGQIQCNNERGKYSPQFENDGIDAIMAIIDAWPGALVVFEDFIMRTSRRDRETLTPVRIIAACDHQLYRRGRFMHKQQPSEAKGTCSDTRMREWGLYERAGGMGHARDADRHAMLAIRKALSRAGTRHLYWPYIYAPDGELVGG